jgi:hypothetical protein
MFIMKTIDLLYKKTTRKVSQAKAISKDYVNFAGRGVDAARWSTNDHGEKLDNKSARG